jgi:hypothetical protein
MNPYVEHYLSHFNKRAFGEPSQSDREPERPSLIQKILRGAAYGGAIGAGGGGALGAIGGRAAFPVAMEEAIANQHLSPIEQWANADRIKAVRDAAPTAGMLGGGVGGAVTGGLLGAGVGAIVNPLIN